MRNFNHHQILLIIVLALGISLRSLGQAGTLDPTYGINGVKVQDISKFEFYRAIINLPNEEHIVVGEAQIGESENVEYLIVKLSKQGNPVSSFGDNGAIRDQITGGYNSAVDITNHTENNFLVLISSFFQNTSTVTVAKFTHEGTPDPSFGTNGYAEIEGGLNGWVAGAMMYEPTLGTFVCGSAGNIQIVKIKDDGSVDKSFGNQGIFAHSLGQFGYNLYAMEKAEDGGILVTGSKWVGSDWDPFIIKVKPEGIIDTSFGTNGVVMVDIGDNTDVSEGMTIQKDGKIIISGGAYNGMENEALIFRYLPNGSYDETFGNQGKVILPTGSNAILHQVATLSDESIIGCGENVIIKLNSDGTPESTFGVGGVVNTGSLFSNDMVLDNQENILLTGYTFDFAGGFDLMTCKYFSNTTTHIETIHKGLSDFRIFPNPTATEIWISSDQGLVGNLIFELFDLQGKLKYTWVNKNVRQDEWNIRLDLNPNLAPGMYSLILRSNGPQRTIKIIKK